MEEMFKLIAAGGGIGVSATWAYWLWKIEPRIKALEEAIYMQSKVDLLRMATSPTVAPHLKDVADKMVVEVDERLKAIQK